jgi:predicted  nucleic acid-binding Zn-ribbon protein
MEFRDLAAKETSALVGRLFTKSAETSRQRLSAFRTAIDGATKALEAALATPGSPAHIEREVTELVARLTTAATAEVEASRELAGEARLAVDKLQRDLKTATQDKAAAQRELEAVKHELTGVTEDCKTFEVERLEAVAALEEETRARAGVEEQVRTLRRTMETVRAESASAASELKTVVAERTKLEKAVAAAQSQAKLVEAKLVAVTAQLDAHVARVKALEDVEEDNERALRDAEARQREAEAQQREAESRLRDAETRLKAVAATDTKLKTLSTELAASAARVKALEGIEQEHTRALTELDTHKQATRELDALRTTVKELEAKLKAATATETRLGTVSAQLVASAARVKALEGAEQAQKRALKDLEARASTAVTAEASLAGRHEAAVSTFDRLLGSFQNLIGASNVDDAMSRMLQCLAGDYARVALFRVKGNRLEGTQQIGFDQNTDISKVIIPLGLDSMLTRAAASGRIEQLTGEELAARSGALFAGDSRPALAMPIIVHGETLAIVYADSGPGAQAPYDPVKAKFAEAVLQHTVSVLMRLSSELKIFAELRAYATSLLDELDEMYQADATARKAVKELHARLKANLDCARTIFQARVETECPEAAPLFEEQLATAIEANRGTAYGDHLAAAAGRADGHGKRKAEAS